MYPRVDDTLAALLAFRLKSDHRQRVSARDVTSPACGKSKSSTSYPGPSPSQVQVNKPPTLVAQPDGTRPGPCWCATRVPQGMTAGVPADCDRGIQKGPVRDSRRLTPDGNRLGTVIVTRRVP
jgi:hypothetical protein